LYVSLTFLPFVQSGLLQKFEEIALPRDYPWIESLTVHSVNPIDVEDIDDDLKRETAFYQSSVAAVKVGLIQLDQSGVPYKRPMDYYAESVKPDSHMAKVKQVLLNEKKKIEEIEERKRQLNLKKYAKTVHAEKKKERSKQKRDALDEIDRFKKRTKHNEASSASFKGVVKKAAKEAKYGRKRTSKKNDSSSINDFSKFNNKKGW
jgi:rRNA-processing protein EBP2